MSVKYTESMIQVTRALHYCPHASVGNNWARVRVCHLAAASLINSPYIPTVYQDLGTNRFRPLFP